jgi:hypothetical protein
VVFGQSYQASLRDMVVASPSASRQHSLWTKSQDDNDSHDPQQRTGGGVVDVNVEVRCTRGGSVCHVCSGRLHAGRGGQQWCVIPCGIVSSLSAQFLVG